MKMNTLYSNQFCLQMKGTKMEVLLNYGIFEIRIKNIEEQ